MSGPAAAGGRYGTPLADGLSGMPLTVADPYDAGDPHDMPLAAADPHHTPVTVPAKEAP
ncbi:hypothetical protein ACFYSC_21525 [Streptosporangium sp. NPDC004379]|uniref:hypothetical protein n=1 Tax=Streptosporangium sp. NPDC004379 TaxID=3366189 RepID=UPI0036B4B663